MRNLFFLLFASISAIAQINPTSFSKIKVVNQTENNDATRVVVQDATTKEFHWVLKSNLGGGGTIPTWHQTLTAGNITNIGAVSGVKAFEVTSPNTGMSFFGETILTSNASKQAEYGLNGFIHKLNDNTQRSKLSYDGLELKTNITGGVATIKSDNLTTPVTLQLPTTSGTLALTNDTTGLVRVANAAAIPAANTQAGGVILLVEDTKKMYRNDGTKWQGL